MTKGNIKNIKKLLCFEGETKEFFLDKVSNNYLVVGSSCAILATYSLKLNPL